MLCAWCEKSFTPNRRWQKYCPGGQCKRAHENAKREAAKALMAKQKPGKNPAAVAMGRQRMAKLTKEQRAELARRASAAASEKRRKS